MSSHKLVTNIAVGMVILSVAHLVGSITLGFTLWGVILLAVNLAP